LATGAPSFLVKAEHGVGGSVLRAPWSLADVERLLVNYKVPDRAMPQLLEAKRSWGAVKAIRDSLRDWHTRADAAA
jgi:hypothetical protein